MRNAIESSVWGEWKMAASLVHQLAMSNRKRLRYIRGFRQASRVLADVKFIDGVDKREMGREAVWFRTALHQI